MKVEQQKQAQKPVKPDVLLSKTAVFLEFGQMHIDFEFPLSSNEVETVAGCKNVSKLSLTRFGINKMF